MTTRRITGLPVHVDGLSWAAGVMESGLRWRAHVRDGELRYLDVRVACGPSVAMRLTKALGVGAYEDGRGWLLDPRGQQAVAGRLAGYVTQGGRADKLLSVIRLLRAVAARRRGRRSAGTRAFQRMLAERLSRQDHYLTHEQRRTP